MAINIKSITEAIKNVLLSALKEGSVEAKLAVAGYIEDAEQRLGNLANGALSGDLNYKFVVEKLKEEATNLKDQLLSITQIVGSNINVFDLATIAMTIFENALKDAITESGQQE